jgi:hypothetical protein
MEGRDSGFWSFQKGVGGKIAAEKVCTAEEKRDSDAERKRKGDVAKNMI